MSKKIFMFATICALSSHQIQARTPEVVYTPEAHTPKHFYVGIGDSIIYSWHSNMDLTGIPDDLKTLLPKTINLFTGGAKEEVEGPEKLSYTKGLSRNMQVGYITSNFGRWELEGLGGLQIIDKTAGISHLGSMAVMGNIYYDFVNTPFFDLFFGIGFGRTWHYNLIGTGKIIARNNNWAAQGKAGISFHLAENVDLVASYTAFSVINKETFNFTNSLVSKMIDACKKTPLSHLLPPGEINLETNPTIYKIHGPRLELHIKF